MTRYLLLLVASVVWLSFTNCRTPTIAGMPKGIPEDKIHIAGDADALNKIIFLTYRVHYDSLTKTYQFRLLKKFFASGQLNLHISSQPPPVGPHYLYYTIGGNAHSQYGRVEDPLNFTREYLTEDGNMATKEFTMPEGELTIRFQYDPDMKYLLIQTFLEDTRTLKTIYYASI